MRDIELRHFDAVADGQAQVVLLSGERPIGDFDQIVKALG